MSASIRFISYNILSDSLCPPHKYPTARDPRTLEVDARLEKIQTRLIEEIAALRKKGSYTDARQLNDDVMRVCVEKRTQSFNGWLSRSFPQS
jgi:hypothetical protein